MSEKREARKGLLALIGAGRHLGLGAKRERMPFVQKHALFR